MWFTMWFTTTRQKAQPLRAAEALRETSSASVLSMRSAFHQQLGEIEASVAHLGALVEQTLDEAIDLLRAWNVPLLPKLPHQDEVSALRRTIQEHVLEVMARQSPVAGDLRALLGAQVVIVELEHMSDTAVAMIEHIVALKRALLPESIIAGDPLHTTVNTAASLDEPECACARLLALYRDTSAMACDTLTLLQRGRSRDVEQIHRILRWLDGLHTAALGDLESLVSEASGTAPAGDWNPTIAQSDERRLLDSYPPTDQTMRLQVCVALIRQDLRQIGACARNICLEMLWQTSLSSP